MSIKSNFSKIKITILILRIFGLLIPTMTSNSPTTCYIFTMSVHLCDIEMHRLLNIIIINKKWFKYLYTYIKNELLNICFFKKILLVKRLNIVSFSLTRKYKIFKILW